MQLAEDKDIVPLVDRLCVLEVRFQEPHALVECSRNFGGIHERFAQCLLIACTSSSDGPRCSTPRRRSSVTLVTFLSDGAHLRTVRY
jgi:hypothetical protein